MQTGIRNTRRLLTLGIALVVLPCSIQAQPEHVPDDPHKAVSDFLPSCGPRFENVDRRVAEAGVGDASYLRVKGFPYLRTDRLMSSYDRELDDPEKLETWLLQLRDNDNFSRDIELRNLGLDTSERSTLLLDMRLCAVWLSFMEAGDPERLRAMIRAVRDTVKAAPAAVAPVSASTPNPDDPAPRIWRTARDDEAQALIARFGTLPRDPLQRTGLTVDGWKALAAEFAPTLVISGAQRERTPGALGWNGDRLQVDPSKPTVYFLPSFARAGETMLMQFHYVVWFTNGNGNIDGVIWRVTLDPQARPLAYDSLGADGDAYRVYPARALEVRSAGLLDSGAIAEDVVGLGPLRVELDQASAHITAVAADHADAPASVQDYALVAYEDLLTLPRDDGTMSAFDAAGRLRQSADQAVMQIGHHAPLQPLKRAFDDPRLLENYFLLPPDIEPERLADAAAFR
jgi:hypothetical protein